MFAFTAGSAYFGPWWQKIWPQRSDILAETIKILASKIIIVCALHLILRVKKGGVPCCLLSFTTLRCDEILHALLDMQAHSGLSATLS